jgi:hypothetical protein
VSPSSSACAAPVCKSFNTLRRKPRRQLGTQTAIWTNDGSTGPEQKKNIPDKKKGLISSGIHNFPNCIAKTMSVETKSSERQKKKHISSGANLDHSIQRFPTKRTKSQISSVAKSKNVWHVCRCQPTSPIVRGGGDFLRPMDRVPVSRRPSNKNKQAVWQKRMATSRNHVRSMLLQTQHRDRVANPPHHETHVHLARPPPPPRPNRRKYDLLPFFLFSGVGVDKKSLIIVQNP